MPRRPRICPAGTCFHVLNRAVARLPLFEKQDAYVAFEQVLAEAMERERLPLFAYCLMPNHWHFVVRPETDEQLTAFFRWLTHTHTMRWHAHYQTQGTGHLYQGRFKAFPIEEDAHLLAVLRYVERNPVRAKFCERASDWRYGSAWRTTYGHPKERNILSPWPISRPRKGQGRDKGTQLFCFTSLVARLRPDKSDHIKHIISTNRIVLQVEDECRGSLLVSEY